MKIGIVNIMNNYVKKYIIVLKANILKERKNNMKQKHFIDIQNIREEDTELRNRNTYAFDNPCIIQITEKYDGSNACACYDAESETMVAFSRKQELNYSNTLNGFWNYVMAFSDDIITMFKNNPNWRVYGEWSNKNKIIYDDTGKIKHWYVYDIYDDNDKCWLRQNIVKSFCKEAGLEYIHELYYGDFISWEHCRSFMNKPAYGERQEGIVIKNQSKLNNWDDHDIKTPCYLKIVNESFKESMKTKEKVIDFEKETARQEAREVMESICTVNRVQKELYKMRDEGILPEKIEPTDFRIIAQNLPKRIYDDLIKEELELVQSCGEFGGKMCQQVCMSIAKDLILGK